MKVEEMRKLKETLSFKVGAALVTANGISNGDEVCRFFTRRYLEMVEDLVKAGLVDTETVNLILKKESKAKKKKFERVEAIPKELTDLMLLLYLTK